MSRCRVDKSVERVVVEGLAFPLGSYPVEEMTPIAGYTMAFESADGDDTGVGSDWEEWPDRYVFDILVTATRVESMCRALFAMLPGRVYPILDVLGHDAFREVDPYVSYDLIGLDRVLDTIRRYRGYFFEDGLVGFGAMSDEPFLYIFVDEHKIVTVRCEVALKEKVEALLAAFDLKEVPAIAGADAATHEHRGVLDAPDDHPELRTAEEIVEELRDEWHLTLNIDPDTNLDDEENELGITGWRCLVRYDPPPSEEAVRASSKKKDESDNDGPEEAGSKTPSEDDDEDDPDDTPAEAGKSRENKDLKRSGAGRDSNEGSSELARTPPISRPIVAQAGSRYVDVLLTADCLNKAVDQCFEAFDQVAVGVAEITGDKEADPVVIATERLTEDEFEEAVKKLSGQTPDFSKNRVWYSAWLV